MTITGRTTANAVVNETNDGRKVVNFSIAVNETYRPKGGEKRRVTTYFSCSYWISEKVAAYLKKGTLLELSGRLTARAYVTKEGEARASLNCHVNSIKFLSGASVRIEAGEETEAYRFVPDLPTVTPSIYLQLSNRSSTACGIQIKAG